ncbi:CGNR zinc finger domain-containing protein [Asticcacaulis sp. DXS10W]|uniref:CGNR zinc finger domain-containing protein n=1 Tax=Asticcacaulis currens TaxID=2984210 RepID=A0ABT5IDM8_9CAUL|nr:CGNR zinc finger domain-containing protein [Asticcacaulis currens]MDC7694268.1 CGNR zinc finger domain-containing protein [Asticcacaulis currens]
MRFSEKYDIPNEFALLYDFVNSGEPRKAPRGVRKANEGDALRTVGDYVVWLDAHGLPTAEPEQSYGPALALRNALREYFQTSSGEGGVTPASAAAVQQAAVSFPMVANFSHGGVTLRPLVSTQAIGLVLGEMARLSMVGDLGRLKMCASDDCNWVFFDRSKPGNRRWCTSERCGNRNKTKAFRARRRAMEADGASQTGQGFNR